MSKLPEIIDITTDFIRLDAFLKFASAVGTGGEAKTFIQDGVVKVNGVVCQQRTKKLYDGDMVCFNGEYFKVHGGTK